MHARYLFLYANRDMDLAESAFKTWMVENGDENTWFESLCAVNDDHDTKLFVEEDASRGYYNIAQELLQERGSVREMWQFAWEITAHQVFRANRRPFIPDGEMHSEYELMKEMVRSKENHELPWPFLNRMLAVFKQDVERLEFQDVNNNQLFKLSRNAWILHRLHDAHTLNQSAPFIHGGDPYIFRCFALPTPNEVEGVSILVADIHT